MARECPVDLPAPASPSCEELILDRNVFVERILPASVLRPLTEQEMGEYRRPFATLGEGLVPTLIWPRQIPIGGVPADVHEVLRRLRRLAGLCPRAAQVVRQRRAGQRPDRRRAGFCRTWPDQAEVTVPGIHFIQEDSGAEIGPAIAAWLRQLPS